MKQHAKQFIMLLIIAASSTQSSCMHWFKPAGSGTDTQSSLLKYLTWAGVAIAGYGAYSYIRGLIAQKRWLAQKNAPYKPAIPLSSKDDIHAPLGIKNFGQTCFLSTTLQLLQAVLPVIPSNPPLLQRHDNLFGPYTRIARSFCAKSRHVTLYECYPANSRYLAELRSTIGITNQLIEGLIKELQRSNIDSDKIYSGTQFYYFYNNLLKGAPKTFSFTMTANNPYRCIEARGLTIEGSYEDVASLADSLADLFIAEHDDQTIQKITSLPHILTIVSETKKPFIFPEFLDMTPYTTGPQNSPTKYRLLACVYRVPIYTSYNRCFYHMIAYTRHKNRWYLCGDDKVFHHPARIDFYGHIHETNDASMDDTIQTYANNSTDADKNKIYQPRILMYERIEEPMRLMEGERL